MLSGALLALVLSQELVPATMVTWGGGKTQAEAATQLAKVKVASKDWKYFKWEPGWPRILESKKVPGAKSGFVVALGACLGPEAEPLAAALELLEPAIQHRPLQWMTPLPCPQGAGWSWSRVARAKSMMIDLSAVSFQRGAKADYQLQVAARATTKAGSKLELFPIGDCDGESLEAVGEALVLKAACAEGLCSYHLTASTGMPQLKKLRCE